MDLLTYNIGVFLGGLLVWEHFFASVLLHEMTAFKAQTPRLVLCLTVWDFNITWERWDQNLTQ